MKNFFYTLIVFFTIVLCLPTNSYADELVVSDEWKTIKELKENIDLLDKANSELDQELKNLNTDYKLKTFLKKDLSIADINKIKKIIYSFNSNVTELENELSKQKEDLYIIDEKKSVLEEKKVFYANLTPFINTNVKEEYLEYVKDDAIIYSDKKDISNEITSKKEILNNKVEKIESKIQEHKDFINKSIEKVIDAKLNEKVNNLGNNPSFKALSLESKKKVLDKTIDKITDKKEKAEDKYQSVTNSWTISETQVNSLDKKIQIYVIAIDKLEYFKDSLK